MMSSEWSKTTRYIAGVILAILAVFIIYLSRSVLPLLVIAIHTIGAPSIRLGPL